MDNTSVAEIERILEQHVRPILATHDGNVTIVDYNQHILRVRLTGQCSGCPSALLTTEEIIAGKIKEYIPDIDDVILVTSVSDDLLAQAKALMTQPGK